ncbi:cytochrome oxidase assembly protein ShyY1 [Streptomyces sp. 846.5]|nr:SURF1 family protein [Streptomyces sp. 846.5]TDU03559.1 cytochrome oxidase assembly protein ShyY1 [Streptomyces sp. 846.5]
MLRILLTRRWVILTLVFFVLIPVMYLLGMWQFHRYQQTNVGNRLISQNLSAGPVPIGTLTRPGATVPGSERYRKVMATGHYDTAHQFVVRHRTDAAGDTIGFYVVTPLITADGDAVLVNRGWVTAGNTTGDQYPTVPGAPSGTVTVSGLLQPDETTAVSGIRDVKGLPDRQFMLINSLEQAGHQPEPVLAGYLQLVGTSPTAPAGDSAELVPLPNNSDSSSMAVVGKGVHLPYAVQWWLFALLIPIAWGALLRREIKDRERKAVVAEKKAAFLAAQQAKADTPGESVGAPAGATGE